MDGVPQTGGWGLCVDCGGGDRGSLGLIVVARSAIFSRLRRRHVAPRCTVGWQLSPPPPDHSCRCLTHSFATVALLAAALADASCALFACRRFSTARPRSAGGDGRRVCGNARCDRPPIRCEAGVGALCRDFCAAACSLRFDTVLALVLVDGAVAHTAMHERLTGVLEMDTALCWTSVCQLLASSESEDDDTTMRWQRCRRRWQTPPPQRSRTPMRWRPRRTPRTRMTICSVIILVILCVISRIHPHFHPSRAMAG
eukprot:COSAG01_NODE_13415_length_1588_cov_3.253862_1_plen_256_part_00